MKGIQEGKTWHIFQNTDAPFFLLGAGTAE